MNRNIDSKSEHICMIRSGQSLGPSSTCSRNGLRFVDAKVIIKKHIRIELKQFMCMLHTLVHVYCALSRPSVASGGCVRKNFVLFVFPSPAAQPNTQVLRHTHCACTGAGKKYELHRWEAGGTRKYHVNYSDLMCCLVCVSPRPKQRVFAPLIFCLSWTNIL